MRNPYKPVNPDAALRDLRKSFKQIQKDEPSAERVGELATFVRTAHDMRQLNMVMHAANLCLDEDPDAPAALIAVYTADEDPEDRLRGFSDMIDLARWIGRDDIKKVAQDLADKEAPEWIEKAPQSEQRRRLRDLGSMFSREFADDIRDRNRFGS